MNFNHRIFKLKGVIQHYSWGGFDFIPGLLNIENQQHKPFAEYWLGAHPNHSSILENEKLIPLDDYISRNATTVLGKEVEQKFSSLPYLFKVLDVRQMLSIQVHPSKSAAAIAFEEENKRAVAVTAPNRNYKDRNHKPELMVALSDFWLLHGFKNQDDLRKVLQSKKELQFLIEVFDNKGYHGLYEEVMMMDQRKVNQILQSLLQPILPLYENDSFERASEDFWAARAAVNFSKNGNYDRGIFSIYFFNLVHLKRGEAIYQPAGMPHAYLEGQNVEVMANSDNVLRAGLTDKHVDVNELMKHVKFEATIPNIINPSSNHKTFSSPAQEFELQEYCLKENQQQSIKTKTGEVFLVMNGAVQLECNDEKIDAHRGESFFAIAESEIELKTLSGVDLFRVTVPDEQKQTL